jgi:hypothetical protein
VPEFPGGPIGPLRVAADQDDAGAEPGQAAGGLLADAGGAASDQGITSAAGAALDCVGREWLRSGGSANRTDLIDQAFTRLRPAGLP